MNFKLEKTDPHSKARTGTITTAHGEIKTPIFMPVGTIGTVKGIHQHEVKDDIKAQIILGNTYHLYLKPGMEVLQKAGGLHKFMNWDMPILTDSGGYQVYSLAGTRKIKEEGVKFQSHIDGSYHNFTPEYAMDIQRVIGADLIMAFDECTPYPCDYNYAKRSMHMTHRWLKRCVDRVNETDPLYGYEQTLLPIVQGSTYNDLRTQSAEAIAAFDLPANAIGGLSVGEPAEELYAMTDLVCDILPKDKPRYLMGVGTPWNILECIGLGVDMMDCVLPTRNARHGTIYTKKGVVNIKNLKWADDFTPLDPDGTSYVDSFYSRAYVRHLFSAGEALGRQITSIHNLAFYLWLVEEARTQIEQGTFRDWKDKMCQTMQVRL